MKLERLTERIWIFPFEEERDRPILGYVRGDHWSLAVDAGHSSAHTEDFYGSLAENGLPLPSLTVLTHWHWDHTFGMHRVNGLTLANPRTDSALFDIRDEINRKGRDWFLSLDYKIRNEYAGGREIIVKNADMVFTGEILLDAGNCPIRVYQTEAPHTDDSTLIEIPGEKVLFLGDAAYGKFPTWESDPVLAQKLIDTIMPVDAGICIESHRDPISKTEALQDLREAMDVHL
ncbi:MAG: hypothetical protein IKP86_12910 [Anaerolineaceae bacterium]|nr:hypothetical protein [Anaerolineaceae bacterium]